MGGKIHSSQEKKNRVLKKNSRVEFQGVLFKYISKSKFKHKMLLNSVFEGKNGGIG